MVILYIIFASILTKSTMQLKDQAFKLKYKQIKGKTFVVPQYKLYDCQKYMLPKLANAPVHHTFFEPQAIQQVYQQMKVDPQKLNHNLNIQTSNQIRKPQLKMGEEVSDSLNIVEQAMKEESKQISIQQKLNKGRPRPPLRQKGFTHFIHIPFVQVLTKTYQDEIFPRIQQEDRDILMPLQSMHMTVMVFRLKTQEDLPKWKQIIKQAKRTNKVSIQGVNIFPIKKNFARVLYLNIKGLDDLIDTIVHRSIEQNLITEQQLSHIKFDKIEDKYKAQPHITLLKTQGEDLFDFTYYLKALKHINLKKVSISEIRLSMIGTHNGEDYYNQAIHYL